MTYNPSSHHRRSIRLKGYDYSQEGLYFITLCAQNRVCLFGKIENGKMMLNDAGRIANECWLNIPNHFPNVILHEFIIMPNHVHGIIQLVGANNYSPEKISSEFSSPEKISQELNSSEFNSPEKISPENNLSENQLTKIGNNHLDGVGNNLNDNHSNHGANNVSINHGAKNVSPLRGHSPSKTVGSIVRGYKIGVTNWFRYNGNSEKIWQRNYWEHIIRDEQSCHRIAEYIINNPAKWDVDSLK
jgi:REP element-mobilizing transposase RayT